MSPSWKFVRTNSWELRRLFNEIGCEQKIKNGEFREKLLKDNHPSAPKANEPYCTRSQIIAYLDSKGKAVLMVHQYKRIDGSLGASGHQDPKRIRIGDTIYYV